MTAKVLCRKLMRFCMYAPLPEKFSAQLKNIGSEHGNFLVIKIVGNHEWLYFQVFVCNLAYFGVRCLTLP